MNKLIPKLLALLYPPSRCPICRTSTEGLCIPCKDRILLGRLRKIPGAQGWSLFQYTEEVKGLLSAFKKNGSFVAGNEMAALIEEFLPKDLGSVDFITYAPSSQVSIKRLGFDHGEVLSKNLAKKLNVPVYDLFLPPKVEQKHLEMDERWKNIKGLRMKRGSWDPLKGKRGLLIDDVYTTGATVKTCLALLEKGGVSCVYLTFCAR